MILTKTTVAILKLLDGYKKRHGMATDSQLAKHLGVSPAAICYIRKGRRGVGAKALRAIMANCKELVTPLASIMARGGDASQ